VLRLAAIVVGAWMYAVPTNWFLGGLVPGWYLGLLTGGGLMMAGAFGLAARRALGGEWRWNDTAVIRTVWAVTALRATVALVIVLLWMP
jgi:hypothetical protein